MSNSAAATAITNEFLQSSSAPLFVTGIAGFVGFSVASQLLRNGISVVGIDNFSDYYSPQLKKDRVAALLAVLEENRQRHPSLSCDVVEGGLEDLPLLQRLFEKHKFKHVIHLAAQAGVRYSLTNPHAYVQSNLVGFVNMLECCRHAKVEHFLYASSSSVYGGNTKVPYSEADAVDHPVSMYAATKKSNEVLAHSYSHLFQLPCTGLRFFTVYGPWGRPDMAVWSFTEKILNDKPVELFDFGKPRRDFTFIDDVVEGVLRVLVKPPVARPEVKATASESLDPGVSWAPFRVMNIGGSHPHTVLEFVSLLEDALGKKAEKKLVDAQPGDVSMTQADTTRISEITGGFAPKVSLAG